MVSKMKPVTDPNILAQLNGGIETNDGLKPVSDPSILAQLNGEQPEEKGFWAKTGDNLSNSWQSLKSAVKGNAEFEDAGNATDYIYHLAEKGFYDNQGFFGKDPLFDAIDLDSSGTFGNNDDIMNRIKKINPKADIRTDKNGNPYVFEDGKRFYGNPPGLQGQDIMEGIGEAVTYMMGGAAGSMAKGLGLGTRMAATGGTEAAINYGAQKMAGREDVDKAEMAVAGLAGGLFEGLTPVVSAAWRKIKNIGVDDVAAGQLIAKQLGAENLTEEQVKRLGNMVKKLDPDQVTPETILQHVELNQTPTLGTLTKNQDILDTEHMLRNSGRESTRKQLAMVDDANEIGLQRAFNQFQDNVSGGQAQAGDYYSAAQQIGEATRGAERIAKKGVNEAYKQVDDAYLASSGFTDAPNRIKKALSDNNVLLAPSTTDRTNDVLKDITKSVQKLDGTKAVSWQAVEAQRQRINSAFKGASDSDKRALSIVVNEYDKMVDDVFEKQLFSGSDEAINSLKTARKTASDYFQKFSGKDKGRKAIQEWLDDGVTPEQISNAFLTKSGIVGTKAPQVAKAYLDVVGRNTPEHNLLKELAVQRFTADKGRAAIRSKLKDAMTNGQTFMNEVFTPKELGFLSRTVSFIDDVTRKGDLGKSSGSLERYFRWANKAAGQDVSLSGMINSIKNVLSFATGGERRALALPTQQVLINPLSGAAAQQAVNHSNQ